MKRTKANHLYAILVVLVMLFGIGTATLREDQSAVVRLFGVGDIFQ